MIKKTKWLIKEAKLRVNYMVNKDCIFCKIASGQIKSNLLVNTEKTIAFADINPVASVHILIVPKRHIESVSTLEKADGDDLVEMFRTATNLARRKNLHAYRLSFNAGRYQHVSHLHMHLLAGSKINWSKL